jgi:putative endonuclease
MVFDHRQNKTKTHFIYPRVECPEPVEGHFYFYILECSDNSLYCGSSSVLSGRIEEHNTGKAAKWTRDRRPLQLVYFEVYYSHLEASRRELQVKGWVRKKKENLIFGKWSKVT